MESSASIIPSKCIQLPEMTDEDVEALLATASPSTSPKLPDKTNKTGNTLVPLWDKVVIEREAQRYRQMVQECWFHQTMRYVKWGEEVERRGDQYRPQPIAARTTVSKSHTKSLCLVANVDPAWFGEATEMEDSGNEEEATVPTMAADDTEGISPILAWQSPGSIPGDATSVVLQLCKQLKVHYDSIATRELNCFYCPNMKSSELSQSLTDARQVATDDSKVIFHYIARGVPPPRGGFLHSFTRHNRISLDTLVARAGTPLVFIADCAEAGEILKEYLKRREEADNEKKNFTSSRGHQLSTRQLSSTDGLDGLDDEDSRNSLQSGAGKGSGGGFPVYEDFLFIGASGSPAEGNALLVQHPRLPSDILTSCLTTPVRMAVLWFIAERPDWRDLHPVLLHLLPGDLTDKKTPLGQLQWAFTAITDCIAWSSLGLSEFSRLFREDIHVAPLFRGYLLAERIMVRGLGGSLSVHPPLPPMQEHSMWDEWENFVERACVCLYRAVFPTPPTSMSTLEYREWLDSASTEWKYKQLDERGVPWDARRQFTMILPTLDESRVRLPNFFHEQLRGVSAAIDDVSKLAFRVQRSKDGGGVSESENSPKSLYKNSASAKSNLRKSAPSLSLKKSISWEEYVGNMYATTTNSVGSRNSTAVFPFLDRLPMLVQGLLVLAFRETATELVARLVDVGVPAVLQCAEANMFRLALGFYWSRKQLYYLMPSTLFIFTKACYADPSLIGSAEQRKTAIRACVNVLQSPIQIAEPGHVGSEVPGAWQRKTLGPFATPTGQRLLCVSLLVMLITQSSDGGAICHQMGVFQLCCQLIEGLVIPSVLLGEDPTRDGTASRPAGLSDFEVLYVSVLVSLYMVLLSEWRPAPVDDNDVSDADEAMAPLDGEIRELPPTSKNNLSRSLSLTLRNIRRMLYCPFQALRGVALRSFSLIFQLPTIDEATSTPFITCVMERLRYIFETNTELRLERLGAIYTSLRWLKRQLEKEFSQEDLSDYVTLWIYRWYVQVRKDQRPLYPEINLDAPPQEDELDFSEVLLRKAEKHNSVRNSVRHSYRHLAGSYVSQQTGVSLANSSFKVSRRTSAGTVRRTLAQACLSTFSNVVRICLEQTHDVCPYCRAHARKIILEEFDFLVSRWFHKSGMEDNVRAEWNFDDGGGLDDFGDEVDESERAKAYFQALMRSALEEKNSRGSYDNRSDSEGSQDDGREDTASPNGTWTSIPKELHPDSIVLRCFAGQGASSIVSYVYRSLSYIANVLLVPLDDYDVHHIVQRRKQDSFHEHMYEIASGLRDSTLWRLRNMATESPIPLHQTAASIPNGCGEIESVLFHPSKNIVLTSTSHGYVQSWVYQTGRNPTLTLKSSYPLSEMFAKHVSSSGGYLRHLYTPPYPVFTPVCEDTSTSGGKVIISARSVSGRGGVRMHIVDASGLGLLCTVHRTGGTQLWSGYTSGGTVRRVAACESVNYSTRQGIHDYLSSYQPLSMRLLLSGTGSVTAWDIPSEQLITVTDRVEKGDGDLPSVLTAHLNDPNLYSLGAGSTVLTYDQRQRRGLITSYIGPPGSAMCVMVRHLRRFPHLIAAGYSGGCVKLWDHRHSRAPVLEFDAGALMSKDGLQSVRHMDIFPSTETFMTFVSSQDTVAYVSPQKSGPSAMVTVADEPNAASIHLFKPLFWFGVWKGAVGVHAPPVVLQYYYPLRRRVILLSFSSLPVMQAVIGAIFFFGSFCNTVFFF